MSNEVSLEDIDIKFEDHPQFNAKLAEMEQKLPPKLGANNGFITYNQVADKEFCYKFLYCWLNNPSNKTDESVKIYNDIIDSYEITDKRFPKIVDSSFSVNTNINNITFDVGFIINIESIQKGGSVPTQKRRKHTPFKKLNRTIKDRAKTR